ncbi:MAG: AEC family transporter [Gammaproteobacteria bacterium]
MELSAISAGLIPLGLSVALGALAKKFLVPDETHWAGLNKITFYLLVPGLIISTLADAEIASIPVWEIALALALSIALVALALGALYWASPNFRADKAGYTSLFQTATRWNAAVALAITGKIYGATAVTVIALSMIVLMPVVNVINVALLANLLAGRRVPLWESLWRVLTNPIIIGCLIGLALALGGIAVWPPLRSVVDALADASIASILLIVGAGLKWSDLSSSRRSIFLSCAFKLALMPLCTLLLAAAFGLRGVVLASVVIVAAVPTAMHGYVLAREMGGDAPLYANAASLQVLLSFITIPCWIWLAGIF